MEVAEGCIPDQNRPLVPILASAEAVAPAITDNFGLEVERRSTLHNYTGRRTPPVGERQRSAHGDITGFEIRRFSNGDLHAADSQVNYKYVQMDVGTLTDSLSPNIVARGREIKAPPHCKHGRSPAGEDWHGERIWRSEGRVSLIFSAFIRTNERETATS
ncbi:hypothetical protein THAOC_28043, partial [Thalassiosira oceanica]